VPKRQSDAIGTKGEGFCGSRTVNGKGDLEQWGGRTGMKEGGQKNKGKLRGGHKRSVEKTARDKRE